MLDNANVIDARYIAFLVMDILHEKGTINDATYKNVKDLKAREYGQSTSLSNFANRCRMVENI